jgi:hypothetical protein
VHRTARAACGVQLLRLAHCLAPTPPTHPQPLEYNYAEFERLLLGMAHHIFVAKKKAGKFEEYLGEMLDMIFKKAGVLVDVAQDLMDE